MKDVAVVGGGLAGLTAAIRCARAGLKTILFEKKAYPHHKVCGEYVSREVADFLEREELLPDLKEYPSINRFQLTSENGNSAEVRLGMGGFGISRYRFDFLLKEKALEVGVEIREEEVSEIQNKGKSFNILTSSKSITETVYVLGAYGKRSRIDKSMDREFITKRSPWVGVKYHIDYEFPDDLITLHNFPGGYCGISRVEEGIVNLCYLAKRENLQKSGSVPQLEEDYLSKNPFLKEILASATRRFEKPLVINEVSFTPKDSVENGIIMIGDSAGLIAPLCGNGMAMAIHSGKMISDLLMEHYKEGENRGLIEKAYRKSWNQNFKTRLWMGRNLQKMFGRLKSSNGLVNLMRFQPGVAGYLINKTHGKVI